MELIKWVSQNIPGEIISTSNSIEIQHENGDTSELWLNKEKCPNSLLGLGELFVKYDGLDLFSSTFKVASITTAKMTDGVKLTFTLQEIRDEFMYYKVPLPESCTPFMVQAGIGIYIWCPKAKTISCWDTELLKYTKLYKDIYSIFDSWLSDIS